MIDSPKRAFWLHKKRAREHNIPFHFTYDEWVAWWEQHLGPDWLKRRGRCKGEYQMARFGDTGPYHPSNVQCVTVEENVRQQKMNGRRVKGEDHPRSKLTTHQIKQIISAKVPYGLAKRFGVNQSTIRKIRRRIAWQHIQLPG